MLSSRDETQLETPRLKHSSIIKDNYYGGWLWWTKMLYNQQFPRLKRDSFDWSKSKGKIIQVDESDASVKVSFYCLPDRHCFLLICHHHESSINWFYCGWTFRLPRKDKNRSRWIASWHQSTSAALCLSHWLCASLRDKHRLIITLLTNQQTI